MSLFRDNDKFCVICVQCESGFMLECAMCDTERGDTEPIMAFVFMLQGGQLQAGMMCTAQSCSSVRCENVIS
jgi:hypothetical protein